MVTVVVGNHFEVLVLVCRSWSTRADTGHAWLQDPKLCHLRVSSTCVLVWNSSVVFDNFILLKLHLRLGALMYLHVRVCACVCSLWTWIDAFISTLQKYEAKIVSCSWRENKSESRLWWGFRWTSRLRSGLSRRTIFVDQLSFWELRRVGVSSPKREHLAIIGTDFL